MTVPSEMKALLLVGDGYTRTPSGSVLEAMEPYLEPGSIAVPTPGPTQVLIKVSLASINPSDVAFIKGQYGQPRAKGQPAGFEGVGTVVASGDEPYPKSLIGKRVAFATGRQQLGFVGRICRRRGGGLHPAARHGPRRGWRGDDRQPAHRARHVRHRQTGRRKGLRHDRRRQPALQADHRPGQGRGVPADRHRAPRRSDRRF